MTGHGDKLEGIFTELSNPVWWFSVVLAGIAINILSSYLRGALDKFLSRSSSWWRNKSTARRRDWEERVDKIASSVEEKNFITTEEFRKRLDLVLLCSLSSTVLQLLFFALIIIKQEGLHTDTVSLILILIPLLMFFISIVFSAMILLCFTVLNTKKAIEEARQRSVNLAKHETEEE